MQRSASFSSVLVSIKLSSCLTFVMTAKKGTSCAYAVILTTYSKNMSDGKANGKTSAMSKVNWSSSLTVSDLQSLWNFSLQRVSSCYLPGWITSFPEMKKLRSDDTGCCVSAVISPLPKRAQEETNPQFPSTLHAAPDPVFPSSACIHSD